MKDVNRWFGVPESELKKITKDNYHNVELKHNIELTLDNVKVTVGNGALVPCIEGRDNVGGIVGVNDGTVQNTNTKLYGRIMSVNLSAYGGGVAGTNNAIIDCAVVNFYSTASVAVRGSIGGIAGFSTGGAIIGNTDVIDGIIVTIEATIETTADNPITNFGGVAGINSGTIYGVVANQLSVVRANSAAGGIAATSSGTITKIVYLLGANGRLSANTVGGVVGISSGNLSLLTVTINGVIGRTTGVAKAGGIAGSITAGTVRNSLIYVARDIQSAADGKKGLLAGESIQNVAFNTWAYAYNSVRTLASSSSLTGFNVLKIVNSDNDTVIGTLDASKAQPLISFKANNSPYMWYSNISILQELGNMANNIYTPDAFVVNQLHHVSYFNLFINDKNDFFSMYQYVNAYDLFNGVMFKLMSDIEIDKTLQPIGTLNRQFTGIFEGNNHTITIVAGGGIAGTAYSGIFGYTSANSIIRNFIVQVDKSVILGSGTSVDAGVIVGKAEGSIINVALNLESSPYLIAGSNMGGFAGEIVNPEKIINCWAVIYNQSVPVVKEGADNRGVNSVGVLGSGSMKVTFAPSTSNFVIAINNQSENAAEYYRLFDNWYANISTRQLVTAVPNYATIYGTVTTAVNNVSFAPVASASNKNVIISFISLDIDTSQDFYDFAQNINTYSDQGAAFILRSSIVINAAFFEPVGTAEYPLTGSFNGCGYTITIVGDITKKQNVFSGLFGYVESTAVISNLIIRADYAERYVNQADYTGQKVGDAKSIYTGFAVSLLKGKLAQVVVVLQNETQIYNVNKDSRGGMVGMVSESAVIVNSWVILPEHYEIAAVGGILNNGTEPPLPNVLYQSGKGLLQINIQNTGYGWSSPDTSKRINFSAIEVEDGPKAYGFIDNKVLDEILLPETSLSASAADAQSWNNREILVLFLNDLIATYQDLLTFANTINAGRNYRGVIYKQTRDIVLQSNYVPVGGQIQIGSGSVGTEYKMVEFIGAYNGNGYKITIPSNVTIAARYAGIFGITGKQARISNLKIVALGTVGRIDEGYIDYTRYAGFLIGLNNGASLKNIIVEVDKNAKSQARIEAGRLAGATNVSFNAIYDGDNIVGWEGLNIAENCWVMVYNRQFNAVRNDAEQLFNNTIDEAISNAIASGANKLTVQGKYNGGINVLTIIAAGEFESSFIGENVIQFLNTGATGSNPNPAKEWYYFDSDGNKQDLSLANMNMYNADKNLKNKLYYASFLDADIDTLEKLMELAEDTNAGYDLYGLIFNLTADINININTYRAIGGDLGGFNATFNGNCNKITISNGVLVEGKYAGVFGNVGDYGVIKNLVIEINGTLGKINYSTTELRDGKVKTMYAGAIAYTTGETRNVIVIGYNAALSYVLQSETGEEGAGGIAIGYDDTNLVYNSWAIVKASNNIAAYGRVNASIGESSINVMKVIGMGALAASLSYDEDNDTYLVIMENDTSIEGGRFNVMGWYSNYAKDNQLSATLGISYYDEDLGRYVPLTTGVNGSYIANASIINSRYEVLIMSTIITTVGQLKSIEMDVNIGGYSFENLEFTLSANLTLLMPVKIGTLSVPFKGVFNGSYNGIFYTITLSNASSLFGYSAGTLKNLTFILDSDIYDFNGILGAVADRNNGTIINTLVRIKNGASITGHTVGGIVGENSGVIENSIVIIESGALLRANTFAGGITGKNTGNIIGSTTSDELFWKQNRSAYLESITRRTGDDNYENYILMATVLLYGS
ncbi:MAG: hypothetical protein EOM87_04305, partial [Clostridia bacterium]|nr:hypothetical protein [Clostridia bacterium]